jgi:8-hydroxy-5-deazaflavin:NADPH oxidoreductase
MHTAIIGMGNIGSRLAKNLVEGGERVFLADKTLAKAQSVAAGLGTRATGVAVSDAIAKADIIVFAVYSDAIKALLAEYRDALRGKIVVDASNPQAPDGKGGFKKTIPDDQSAGQLLSTLVPSGTELVKAFGSLGAPTLASGANRAPERAVMFYATDYPDAGKAVAKLITASGFAPVSVGGIAKSARIEMFGDLHETGKLGKLVSAKEAAPLI